MLTSRRAIGEFIIKKSPNLSKQQIRKIFREIARVKDCMLFEVRQRLFGVRILRHMSKKTRKYVPIGDQVEKVDHEAPENWELLYSNILEMRKEKTAPVDTMGCEKVQDMEVEPKVNYFLNPYSMCMRFEICI